MEKKILRLLIVDDSPDDAEVAVAMLRKAGYLLKNQRVQDLASMQAALDKSTWDVVLSEYTLPHFGAQLALDLIRRADLDIPFLVVTRNIRDQDLVKIMRNGAHDVILKSQLSRLAPAVERELLVAEDRIQFRKMSQTLNEVERKNRAIIEGSREAISYCMDGMHVDANKTYLEIFGYQDLKEIEGVPVMNLIDKANHASFKEYLRKISSGNPPEPREFQAIKKDGASFHVELAASMITLKGENCTQFVVADISKRKSVENRLQYLNQRDPLTGLFNRHHFTLELTKALEKVKQEESQSALLYLDLNELKEINDALGHAAGDRLLLKIARLFHEKLGESAVLARFSGDEFIAMLHGMDEKKIKGAVTSLLSALKETTYSEGGKVFRCDGTIGVVVIDKNTVDAQTALNLVYQACQSKRPQKPVKAEAPVPGPAAQALTASMEPVNTPTTRDIETSRRTPVITASGLDWESRLKTALEKDGFQLAYQPIVNLHGDAAEFFEVLIRLVGRHGELIHAGEFMAAADQLGLLESIDQWVIRQSIQSLSVLHNEGRLASFFINLSPASLKNLDFLAMLQKQLSATRVKPEHLILEADESAIMANPREAAVFMQAARRAGCRFSVDNFGNNLSTLNRLRDMPIDFLKITGSLIRNLSDDILTRTSLKAIIDLAKTMNRQTIAKFVEQADDLGILWNLGFDYVQGNYFQHADSHTDFEFADEATLSSEVTTPSWTTNYNR